MVNTMKKNVYVNLQFWSYFKSKIAMKKIPKEGLVLDTEDSVLVLDSEELNLTVTLLT